MHFDISKCINTAISCNEKTALIFLDLKIAFDSVNREKLLKNLKCWEFEAVFWLGFNHIYKIDNK